MSVLYITTKDRLCPRSDVALNPMLQYGVPCDWLGLPILPVYLLLSAQFEIPQGVRIGLGRLDYFDGLTYAVAGVNNSEQLFPKFVTDHFTEVVQLKQGHSRVLKAGLTFSCPIEVPSELRTELQSRLSAVRSLGVAEAGISGRVELRVDWQKNYYRPQKPVKLQPELQYKRLRYAIRTVTPLCASLPYESGNKAERYISGELIRNWLKERLGERFADFAGQGVFHCANAYPSCCGSRGLPPLLCIAQRKMNRRVLLYRPAKDSETYDTEITTKLSGFLLDPTAASMKCFGTKMRTVFPVSVSKDEPFGVEAQRGAIREGTVYRGFFEGTDEQIRLLAALIAENPECFLGFYTKEGYGEAVILAENVEAAEEPGEQLYRTFDLVFASDAIVYSDRGVSVCDCDSILKGLEQRGGLTGRLRITEQVIVSKTVIPLDGDFKLKNASVRAVSAGSMLRLESIDGQPVDVSALNGAFLGDRNGEGFGELQVFPASDRVLRYVEEAEADEVETLLRPNTTELQYGARFVRQIMDEILRYRVSLMALNDAAQESPVPEEDLEVLFLGMRRKYNDECDIETMKQWYREAVKLHA